LWRKLKGHPVMKQPHMLQMVIYRMLSADHEDGYRVMFAGTDQALKPGQFITGRHRLARDLGIPASTAWTRLLRLANKRYDFLTTEHDKAGTIVTIKNWEAYQCNGSDGLTTPVDNNLTIGGQQLDTLNNNKNNKHPKKKPPTRKRVRSRPNPDVRAFLDWWCAEWERAFEAQYPISYGKEGAIAKRLLKMYPLEKLQDLAGKFFVSDDEWMVDKGYTLTLFQSQLPKLLAKKPEPKRWWEGIDDEKGGG